MHDMVVCGREATYLVLVFLHTFPSRHSRVGPAGTTAQVAYYVGFYYFTPRSAVMGTVVLLKAPIANIESSRVSV